MARKRADSFHYAGFPSPNGTVVPDDVFDVLMPELSEAELRVLLYIIRRTFGFKKQSDAISLSQMVDGVTTRDGRVLDRGTGMSRRGVMNGCTGLLEKGIIAVERRLSEQGDNEINIYSLRFRAEQGVGNEMPYRGERGAPGVGHTVPPQQTGEQQTDRHHSNIRTAQPIVDNSAPPDASSRHRAATTSEGLETVGTVVTRVPLGEAIARWQEHQPAAAPAKESAPEGRQPPRPTAPRPRGRPRQVIQQDEDYQVLQAYMADFARELGDRAPLKASTTRLYNLYKRSGLDREAFIAQIYASRAVVKERSAGIRSQSVDPTGWGPVTHKTGYWFAVLEDLLGLREHAEPAPADREQRSRSAAGSARRRSG